MRIVVTLLIAVTAGFWLLAWWLMAEPIGAATTVPIPRNSIVSPDGGPAPRASASTAATPAGAPHAAPAAGDRAPAGSPGLAPPLPPAPSAVIDPFADGGPRPVFVEPPRPTPRVPSAEERPAQLAPPPMGAQPRPPSGVAPDDAAARQRSGSSVRP